MAEAKGPIVNPSYLCINAAKNALYAVNETAPGYIVAYAIEQNHQLTFLNREATGLDSPVHLLFDNLGKTLFMANYGDGSTNSTSGLTVMPIQHNHKVTPYEQLISFSSTTTVSHTHGLAKTTIQGIEYIFATDLGANYIYAYKFDSFNSTPLQLFAKTQGSSGQGPRHMAISKDGAYLYVANEFDPAYKLASSVSIYRFDPSSGLTYLSSFPACNTQVQNYAGEIALCGRYLYVSNRGADNISQFQITNGGQNLKFMGQFSHPDCQFPRHFAITKSGKFLVAAYQKSNNVMIFKIGIKGALTPVSGPIDIETPTVVALLE